MKNYTESELLKMQHDELLRIDPDLGVVPMWIKARVNLLRNMGLPPYELGEFEFSLKERLAELSKEYLKEHKVGKN